MPPIIAKAILGAWPVVGLMVAVIGVASCAPEAEHRHQSAYDTYLSRLARTLDEPAPAGKRALPPRYPERRARRLTPPDIRIGPLQAVALSQCDGLGRLMGERNSILGRVMAPSQQLIYESRFRPAARRCLEQLLAEGEARADAAASLNALLDRKARGLIAAKHNAAFDSDEVAAFFSLATQPAWAGDTMRGYQPGDVQQLAALVEQAGAVALGDAEAAQLEAVLSRLAAGGGGQLLVTVADTQRRLNRATALIHARLDRQALCFDGHHNPRAAVAQTVFTQQYAGVVQPQLARLASQLHALTDGVVALHAASGAGPDFPIALKRFRTELEAFKAQFDQAILDHARAWQRLLGQCGMMPTGPPDLANDAN